MCQARLFQNVEMTDRMRIRSETSENIRAHVNGPNQFHILFIRHYFKLTNVLIERAACFNNSISEIEIVCKRLKTARACH